MRTWFIATTAMVIGSPLSASTAQPEETGGWVIEVIGIPVTPTHATATVRVSAVFPGTLYAFFTGGFDLDSSDPMGRFFDICLPAPLGPLCPPPPTGACGVLGPGRPNAGGVTGAGFVQLNGIGGCIAYPANPLSIWEARWTTTDFTRRTVRLATANTPGFGVFFVRNSPAYVDLVATNQFRHGSAVIEVTSGCYADCDTSTGVGVLDIFDFLCFQNLFAAGDPYACDCDTSTGPGACDVFDFLCFQNRFAAGCP